jgi:uncharacterized protein (DUF2164 family)
MAIELAPDLRRQALASITRFAHEELELEIGDLKAGTVLEFFLRELAPTVYNRGVADAQRYIQDRAIDLEGACREDEFAYWKPPAPKRGRPR